MLTCILFFLCYAILLIVLCDDCILSDKNSIPECNELVEIESYSSANNIGIVYCIHNSIIQFLNTTDDINSTELMVKMNQIPELIDKLNEIELHHLLYHINIKTNIFHQTHGFQNILYSYIQQIIFKKEFEMKQLTTYKDKYVYPIEQHLDMFDVNNTLLINFFYDLLNEHNINCNVFLEKLVHGHISSEIFDILIQSIYPFTRVWHLIISGIANKTPLEFRHIIFRNCLDETMFDNQSHPILFQKIWKHNAPTTISPIYEVFYSFNSKIYAAFHSKSIMFTFGAFAFFEHVVSKISDKVFIAAQNYYNLNVEELSFWYEHTEIDVTHSNELFIVLNEMINTIKTSETLTEPEKINQIHEIINGGMFLIDAEVGYLDRLLYLHESHNIT